MRKKSIIWLVLVVLLIPALNILAAGKEEAEKVPAAKAVGPNQGGTLIVGMAQDVNTLDAPKTVYYSELTVALNLYDRLAWNSPDDLKPHPHLAESWEANADATSYTIKLRKNIKFQDGTPFNAEAVKFNFDRLADPKTAAPYAGSLLPGYISTEVLDPYTVKVNFKEPVGSFINNLTSPAMGMASPAAVQKYGDKFGDHCVSTGPFILQEFVPKDHITLLRNPDYKWGPLGTHGGAPYVDKVIIRIVVESPSRLASLDAGESDIIQDVPPIDAKRLQSDPHYQVLKRYTMDMDRFWVLNTEKFPTDDPKVREAIACAINQQEYSEKVFAGLLEPVKGIISRNTLGYQENPKSAVPYDLSKAKKILDDNGWKIGSDGIREKNGKKLTLTIVVFNESQWDEVATVAQSQLTRAGFKVEVLAVPVNASLELQNAGRHNLCSAWYWWGDPNGMRIWFHSSHAGAIAGWAFLRNAEVDRLLEDGDRIADRDKRAEIYGEVQNWLLSHHVVVPIVAKAVLNAARADVKGLMWSPTGENYFLDTWLDR